MDVNFPIEPPVNNLIQPTICDRVGANALVRTHVANSQLNTRLLIQERVLNKYKMDAERAHRNEKRRMRREMRKIQKKKPDYVEEFDVATGSKTHSQRSDTETRQRSLSEGSDHSGNHCRRFYSHHYNVKDPTQVEKKEKEKKRPENTDYFNARMRCFYLNMSGKYFNTSLPTFLEHPDQIAETDEHLDDSDIFNLPDDIRKMDIKECEPVRK